MSEPRLAHLWFVFWDEPDLTRTTLLGASIAAAILTLAIVSARIGYGSLPGDYYGVWLFFSVVIGYTVATGSYLLPKTIEDLNALQPIITVSDADFERLRHGVAHHPIRAQRLQTAIGLVAGIIHDTILGGMFRSFSFVGSARRAHLFLERLHHRGLDADVSARRCPHPQRRRVLPSRQNPRSDLDF